MIKAGFAYSQLFIPSVIDRLSMGGGYNFPAEYQTNPSPPLPYRLYFNVYPVILLVFRQNQPFDK